MKRNLKQGAVTLAGIGALYGASHYIVTGMEEHNEALEAKAEYKALEEELDKKAKALQLEISEADGITVEVRTQLKELACDFKLLELGNDPETVLPVVRDRECYHVTSEDINARYPEFKITNGK